MPGLKVDTNSPLPRYYQVYASLEQRIRDGEFGPGDALPSERQLAVDYGVSRLTVVKALDMLVDAGFIDRQHGRGNFVLVPTDADAGEEECRIAFCVPTPSETYIYDTLRGAMRVAMRHHSQLQVVETGDGPEEVRTVELLRSRGVDGLVLFSRSTHLNRDLYAKLLKERYPFVMVDRYCPDVHPDVVVFDDECVGYELTNLLIQQGHRRVAMLVGSETFTTSVQERLNGYRRALAENHIAYDAQLVGAELNDILDAGSGDPAHLDENYRTFTGWMREHGPTAVVAVNNYLAERANAILTKIQIALMRAVIDDHAYDVDCQLSLSLASITHRSLILDLIPLVALGWQSGELLGEKAVELLLERIYNDSQAPPRIVRLPMKIRELEAEPI